MPVPGEPAVSSVFERSHGSEPIRPGSCRPAPAKLLENAIHSCRALEAPSGQVDCPCGSIGLLTADPVAGEQAWLLVRRDQHTAGPVLAANPARHPRADAATSVKKQHDHDDSTRQRARHVKVRTRQGPCIEPSWYAGRLRDVVHGVAGHLRGAHQIQHACDVEDPSAVDGGSVLSDGRVGERDRAGGDGNASAIGRGGVAAD